MTCWAVYGSVSTTPRDRLPGMPIPLWRWTSTLSSLGGGMLSTSPLGTFGRLM
jgi:hypothetical protein